METALTKTQLIEVMDMYIKPIYTIIGSVCALFVIACAVILVIKPFIKRIR